VSVITPGASTYPGAAVFPSMQVGGVVTYQLCQRIDSGSMAPVLLNEALISARTAVGVPPSWATCWQVATDPFNAGAYLLVGWLSHGPNLIPTPLN
jgi:hypothetical protein